MNLQCHADLFDTTEVLDLRRDDDSMTRAVHAPPSQFELKQGQRIGPCTVLGVLAEGRMGRLYRARRVDTGARMVLQCLTQPEADAYDLSRTPIQHPNLWPLHSAGRVADLSYLLTQELSAPAWLDPNDASPRSVQEALRVLLQVTDAVACLHRHGLLHLRVSAANVRLLGTQAMLMDHGTSRYLHGRGSLVWAGATQDSPWLAPEQRQAGTRVSKQTDVYALGALLLAAVSGQYPEAFEDLPPADWRQRAALVPSAVLSICARALHPEPRCRFDDASALALHMRQYLQRIRRPDPRAAWSGGVWQRLQQLFVRDH